MKPGEFFAKSTKGTFAVKNGVVTFTDKSGRVLATRYFDYVLSLEGVPQPETEDK